VASKILTNTRILPLNEPLPHSGLLPIQPWVMFTHGDADDGCLHLSTSLSLIYQEAVTAPRLLRVLPIAEPGRH